MNDTISVPLPEQIADAAAAIRKTWSEAERQRRQQTAESRQVTFLLMLFSGQLVMESA